jgi:predicted pyridoxine 5'-phosphate oxidase superfamily flavin-nucleotide-binding protein
MSSPDRVATSSIVVDHETVRPGDRPMTEWPFHPGERQAQARAGFDSHGGAIRAQMPAQHRTFFEQLPFVVVASLQDGWPVATLWSGAPGFVRAPDPETLQIAVALDPADPTTPAFAPGAPFGLRTA